MVRRLRKRNRSNIVPSVAGGEELEGLRLPFAPTALVDSENPPEQHA